jgi:hypothetical protein
MPSDARRKERQRLKREKKKAAQRKAQSNSPYKRIGQAGQVEACYVNSDWRDSGMASVYVIRRNPEGGHAIASFLIDVWCAGLKDAWGRIDFMQEDIDHALKRARDTFELQRIDVEAARDLVAAGIRFARRNGFRLPPHHDRCVHLLGGAGDINSADLSGFGKDGKLRWVGPLDDLRRRLIACTPEQFMSRPDVEFIANERDLDFGGAQFDDEDDEDDDFDDQEPQDLDALIEGYRQLLDGGCDIAAQGMAQGLEPGEQPHPRLADAVRVLVGSSLVERDRQLPIAELNEDGLARRMVVTEMLTGLVGDPEAPTAELPEDLNPAIEQARRCFDRFRGELLLGEAINEVSPTILDPKMFI